MLDWSKPRTLKPEAHPQKNKIKKLVVFKLSAVSLRAVLANLLRPCCQAQSIGFRMSGVWFRVWGLGIDIGFNLSPRRGLELISKEKHVGEGKSCYGFHVLAALLGVGWEGKKERPFRTGCDSSSP